MIRHAKDMEIEEISNMLGGRKFCNGYVVLTPAEMQGARAFFGRAIMPPGGSFGFHEQNCRPEGDMEVYYILSGKAMAYEEDHVEELGPGDVFLCPNGLWNGLKNHGDEDLWFLSILLHRNPAHDPAEAGAEG